jgi:hypothetical protein
MENTLLDRVFRNSEGKIIIIQRPNLPIFIWTLASLLKLFFTTGIINLGLEMIAFASLFSWAWGELFEGVNYFRRGLGLLVIIALNLQLSPLGKSIHF